MQKKITIAKKKIKKFKEIINQEWSFQGNIAIAKFLKNKNKNKLKK